MITLRTVVPNGISVVDGDGERRIQLSACNSDEARVEAIIYGCTRAREATASNAVSTRVVVESDCIANSGSGRVWRKHKAVFTNVDGMGRRVGGCHKGRDDGNSESFHVAFERASRSSIVECVAEILIRKSETYIDAVAVCLSSIDC